MEIRRTTFLIDGFNLYHSLIDASKNNNGISIKWLDLKSLFESCLPILGKVYQLQDIYYFTAIAIHRNKYDPRTTARHQNYIDCLLSTDVKVQTSRFKRKDIWCNNCNNKFVRFEEKETDVAVAVKLVELFLKDACDTAVIVSGDTDVAPAIKMAKDCFPNKEVAVAFPYNRVNEELTKLADSHFKIKKERCMNHQLSNPFTLKNGRTVNKPDSW